MDRRQRRNPSAFSSNASTSLRFRPEKFSGNPPKTSNSLEDARHLKNADGKPQRPEREVEEEQDLDNLPSLVGTCPFMCPGKKCVLMFSNFLNCIFLLFYVGFREIGGKQKKIEVSLCFYLVFSLVRNFINKVAIFFTGIRQQSV